ncbi:hypothetical protein P7C70_g5528, partial [Phenoliferia sp. Uapishka_3]
MTENTGLKYTSLEEITPAYKELQATFRAGTTRPLPWRKHQLKKLGFLLQDNEKAITDAVFHDLSRPAFETILCELEPTKHEINEACKELSNWAKTRKAKTNWTWALSYPTITPCPKGVSLLIGTWNFPICTYSGLEAPIESVADLAFPGLLIGPLVGAIAAGCPAVIKPSEQDTAVAALFAELIPKYLDTSAYKVVNGAIDETTALLKLRWDHIFYTGGGTVGKIIAHAAAEHLTPVTLELGGKSPALVFDDADVVTAAKRIMWGKFVNSGQICMSPDYIMCTQEMQPKLVAAFESALKEFNPPEGDASPRLVDNQQYSRIVSRNQFNRIKTLIDETKGRVVIGGTCDEQSNKVEITIVADVQTDDVLMQGEIFGPVLPILVVETSDEMIDYINDHDNPLALYVFTQSTANKDYIFKNTRSGACLQNDVLVQFIIPGLPFGGAGPSGYGNYHGKASFDTFSHERSFAHVPTWLETVMKFRYPPYTPAKMKQMLLVSKEVISR